MTIASLAAEFGVSRRTILRDLEELSAGGFPVYCEHGPGGGVRILEDYRGGVKTLTRDEVDALQLVRIPDPLVSLETGKTMQRALLKLMASLPDHQQNSPNLYIDWNWWQQSGVVAEGRLEQLYKAVCERQTLKVEFPLWNGMIFSQEVDPYGVVAKAGEWYLVYAVNQRVRMRRISDFLSIERMDYFFIRPLDFDLETTWRQLCEQEENEFFNFPVELHISPQISASLLAPHWGIPYKVVSIDSQTNIDGWQKGILVYENLIAARTHLLGWGNAVKVISPDALRFSLLDFAAQIGKVYQ